jgi:hypothetical protein
MQYEHLRTLTQLNSNLVVLADALKLIKRFLKSLSHKQIHTQIHTRTHNFRHAYAECVHIFATLAFAVLVQLSDLQSFLYQGPHWHDAE